VLTVAGIPVYVAPSSLVVALVIAVIFGPRVERELPGIGSGWALLVAGVFAVLLYASVLLHELAHSLVALRSGLPVLRIRLDLLGGFSETAGEPRTPGRQALIAAVGPLTNLALAGLGVLAVRSTERDTVLGVLLLELTIANVLVGVFNLLPGLPLDGGRVVAAGVWRVTGSADSGTRLAAYGGRAVAVALLAVTFVLPLALGRQPSLTGAVFGTLVGLFIWTGAGQALRVTRLRQRLPRLVAGPLARASVAVSGDTPLAEALRRQAEVGARSIVVVDSVGAPVGIVEAASVVATPVERRAWVDVASVARRLGDGLVLPFDLSGERLISALRAEPAGEYLVVGPDGSLVGVLATSDVERELARS